MPTDWLDLSYLRDGTPRQRAAFAVLAELDLMRRLAAFGPVLVGTIPIDVDIETSDLDILCHAPDLAAFEAEIRAQFGGEQGFRLERSDRHRPPAVVAGFERSGFAIELFGQDRPAVEQHGYRHMVAEARLLALGGEPARAAIRALKRSGLKTEPAFAQVFGLPGDPYQALLDLDGDPL